MKWMAILVTAAMSVTVFAADKAAEHAKWQKKLDEARHPSVKASCASQLYFIDNGNPKSYDDLKAAVRKIYTQNGCNNEREIRNRIFHFATFNFRQFAPQALAEEKALNDKEWLAATTLYAWKAVKMPPEAALDNMEAYLTDPKVGQDWRLSEVVNKLTKQFPGQEARVKKILDSSFKARQTTLKKQPKRYPKTIKAYQSLGYKL